MKQNQFRENAVTLLNQSCPFLQIRPLPALTELRTLHMRNTQRNLTNIPVNLEGLFHLEDVDMSQNELTKIPEGLLSIPNLKRLNLGSNQITEISTDIERWQQMETHSKFAHQAAGNASEVVLDADGEGDEAVQALLPRMESFKNCPEMRKLLKFLCQIYNFTESNKVTFCIVSFSFLTVCGAIIIFSFFLYLT